MQYATPPPLARFSDHGLPRSQAYQTPKIIAHGLTRIQAARLAPRASRRAPHISHAPITPVSLSPCAASSRLGTACPLTIARGDSRCAGARPRPVGLLRGPGRSLGRRRVARVRCAHAGRSEQLHVRRPSPTPSRGKRLPARLPRGAAARESVAGDGRQLHPRRRPARCAIGRRDRDRR